MKIKIVLKRLVQTYGYDMIGEFVPEEDARLLTHMRKLAEQAERREAVNMEDGRDLNGGDSEEMIGGGGG